MDFGLANRVALVAAGSKGLGRAVAEDLAAEGAAVVICARGREGLDEACRDMAGRGGRVHGIEADVSVPGEPARVVSETAKVFGNPDIVVTNSGGPRSGLFETLTDADWDQAVRTLLTNAVSFARASLPAMRAKRWGRIINITSIAARQPVEGLMLSNSVRAGVLAFAKTLSNEVAADGITVNNLLPGYTRTDRVTDLAKEKAAAGGNADDLIRKWEAEVVL